VWRSGQDDRKSCNESFLFFDPKLVNNPGEQAYGSCSRDEALATMNSIRARPAVTFWNGTEMIRWGIIGCGDVAKKRVAGAIQNDADSELIAVCRRDQTKLKQFQAEFNVPHAFESADELMCSDDIDAMYIATPVSLHKPQTVFAANHGKHVLVEKPMAMNSSDCEEMIAACAANDVRLGVAYYRQFYPVVARMQELIQQGEIGKVLSVSAVTATPFALNSNEDGYWRVLPELGGGGALMDIGSHRLDLFLAMFGNVTQIKAVCGTVAADYNADDSALAVMRFESGIHGSLQCYFGSEADPDEFSVLGTTGRLVSRPLNGGELLIERAAGRSVEQHPPNANFNAPSIADFVTSINTGQPPRITGAQGQAVNELMEQAYADSACR
jgi:predicted dehydrogenase